MPGYQIVSLPGYTTAIGQLVDMITYSRQMLVRAVEGLTRDDLDHLHDSQSNSIGALLAHVAAVEHFYQVTTFDDRQLTEAEERGMLTALDLGEAARREIRGRDLETYLTELADVRYTTLARLAERDDDWLVSPLTLDPAANPHWAWFHVMEDETNHRGQIRWLRNRLPKRDT